jgi:hypothetical protein
MLQCVVSYKLTDVSEVLSTLVIRVIRPSDDLKRRSVSTRLHGAKSQRTDLHVYCRENLKYYRNFSVFVKFDDRAIEVRSPAEAKDFSSTLCVQTGSGAHPASCTMGTGDPFPWTKARPGRDADHSPPSSAEVENE